jgi:hypothetical protein
MDNWMLMKEVNHMIKIIPIALLLSGLIFFGGSLDKATTASSFSKEFKLSTSLEIQSAHAVQENLSLIPPLVMEESSPAVAPPPKEDKRQFRFEMVNDISLQDDVNAVIAILGKPLSKQKDPFLSELEIYAYPKMNIGFSNGIVDYVEVLVTAGTAKIDGVQVPIEVEGMKKALGEPDFVAEDGIVFQRKQAFIKLFTSMETGEVTSIQFYNRSNI